MKSKHWIQDNVWCMLQPLMFWKGDTVELFEEEKIERFNLDLHVCIHLIEKFYVPHTHALLLF